MKKSDPMYKLLVNTLCWVISGLLMPAGMLCAQTNGNATLRVGIVPYKSAEAREATYRPLFEYLGEKLNTGVSVDWVEGKALAYGLSQGAYDLGVFTPFPYLEAKQDFPELGVFASHFVNDSGSYQGVILVRKDSPFRTLEDLRGKMFLFVKITSTSGYLYPRGIFNEQGIIIDQGFFDYSFSGGHRASLKALANGEVQGVAVDQSAFAAVPELDPGQFRVLESFEIPYHAYVPSPSMDPDLRSELEAAMLAAHKDPGAASLFQNPLGITRWVARDDTYYNGLRRYLNLTRIQPALKLAIHPKSGARSVLSARGDLLDILQDNFYAEAHATERFTTPQQHKGGTFREVHLDLGMIDTLFHCQVYLEDQRLLVADLSMRELYRDLPVLMVHELLKAFPVQTTLIKSGASWIIPYGTNDGLNAEDYVFEVAVNRRKSLRLESDGIEEITPTQTILVPEDGFQRGSKVVVRYEGTPELPGGMAIAGKTEEGFWDNIDNRWGVVGLIVAFLSVAVGAYFTRRKKRRFQTMLYESNALLRECVQGAYNLESQLIEQEQKISHSLEKGWITENQFLILKHRLEDIEIVIRKLMTREPTLAPEMEREISEMLSDGKLTEKEFSRIISMVKKTNSFSAGEKEDS